MTIPQNISYTAEQAGLSAVAGALTQADLSTLLTLLWMSLTLRQTMLLSKLLALPQPT